jgi:hypothetical protein
MNKPLLTRDQQREKLRAELKEEAKHPTVWYDMSKKQKEKQIHSNVVYDNGGKK